MTLETNTPYFKCEWMLQLTLLQWSDKSIYKGYWPAD